MGFLRRIWNRKRHPTTLMVKTICSHDSVYKLLGTKGVQWKNVSLGPDLAIYILILVGTAKDRTDDGSSVKTQFDTPQQFKVIRVVDERVEQILHIESTTNFRYAQPLPDSEFLLVGSRCKFSPKCGGESNAKIYNQKGQLVRSFTAGDGIMDVQTTLDGTIWVGYIDEGIFGNSGWIAPIGRSGLASFNRDGTRTYEYDPGPDMGGLGSVAECYALNVGMDNRIWFYYYTGFYLALIDGRFIKSWKCGISGAEGVVVSDKYILFYGDYDSLRKGKSNLHLHLLNGLDDLTNLGSIALTHDGRRANLYFLSARGPHAIFTGKSRFYRCQLP